jgi:hypothetical protein
MRTAGQGRNVRTMRDRLLRPFHGTGLYPVAGVLLLVFAMCFLVANLVSPSAILWTGTPVAANERGGIVYYQYHGQGYSIDDLNSYGSGPRTVYLDPSDPARAMIYTTGSRIFDVVTVGAPLVAAAGFFIAGFLRKRRNGRKLQLERETAGPDTFGQGLDPEVIAQVIARRKTAELARRSSIRRRE